VNRDAIKPAPIRAVRCVQREAQNTRPSGRPQIQSAMKPRTRLPALVALAALCSLAGAVAASDATGYERSGPVRVFVACAFHGREWATEELCRAWERRVEHLRRVATPNAPLWTEWRFVHNVNPEGSARAREAGNACQRGNGRGVDLNRNFPRIPRCPSGSDPYHPPLELVLRRDYEEFPGAEPLSEPETARLARELEAFEPDVAFFVHTGAEAIVYPYDACFEPVVGVNGARQHAFAAEIAKHVGVPAHRIGTGAAKLGYASAGTALDWAAWYADVALPFVLETYEPPARGCGELVAATRRVPTANMTSDQCEVTFVPRSAAKRACAVADIEGYVRRWLPLVDAVEALAADAEDRATLQEWLLKAIEPSSVGAGEAWRDAGRAAEDDDDDDGGDHEDGQ